MAKTKIAVKSATVSEIVDRIQALTPEQQQQVTRLLDKLQSQPTTTPTGQSLQDRLREIGWLAPSAGQAPTELCDFTPIPIKGKPVSQTLIEDRR